MLFVGGALVGGAYSFFRSKKPWWWVAALGVIGVIWRGLSFWTLQNL